VSSRGFEEKGRWATQIVLIPAMADNAIGPGWITSWLKASGVDAIIGSV